MNQLETALSGHEVGAMQPCGVQQQVYLRPP
jgi:hypothetical protein